jgi:hypothetical protein
MARSAFQSCVAATPEATGNTFGPELDPFLPFVLEIGHVTPDINLAWQKWDYLLNVVFSWVYFFTEEKTN